ncbi:MAG: 16S rRNA (cytosine(967)-C(5))-methyltransferase [Verrucomicrobia bacterium]|nr:MAG: 16S rRNA (cytosine(967)-C(5))-methyltransferase [Verrucomicrobiota bacterium]
MTNANTQPERANTRGVAAKILATWLERDEFPDRALDTVTTDRAFVQELVFGVVRQRRALEWVFHKLAQREPGRPLFALTLVGLYQLLWLDDVAPFAAVHETVEAAKELAGTRAANFLNAVLRRAQRETAALANELKKLPPALRLSHPDVLFERWTQHYGKEKACAICKWDNQPAETVLRLNIGTPEQFSAALTQAGIAAQPLAALGHNFFVLPRGVRVTDVPGYREGWFAVQDPATSLAVDLLAPQPGENILDACAAPGGKALDIAARLQGNGCVVAMERHADRMARLRENVERAGGGLIRVVQGDAAAPEPARQALLAAGHGELFDGLLLDVPCSNTGVLRRRPDARWRFSAARLGKLTAAQLRILHGASALVRPGGRFVYSTCSIEPEENEQLIKRWLADHYEFRFIRQRLVLPGAEGTDGAFAALIERAAALEP